MNPLLAQADIFNLNEIILAVGGTTTIFIFLSLAIVYIVRGENAKVGNRTIALESEAEAQKVINSSFTNTQTQVVSFTQELIKLSEQVSDLKADAKIQEYQLEDLRTNIKERDEIIKKRDATIKERNATIKERDATIDKLTNHIETLETERDKLVQQRDKLNARIDELTIKISELSMKLDTKIETDRLEKSKVTQVIKEYEAENEDKKDAA